MGLSRRVLVRRTEVLHSDEAEIKGREGSGNNEFDSMREERGKMKMERERKEEKDGKIREGEKGEASIER